MDNSTLLAAGKLLAVLLLVLANGFFVAGEFSLVAVRRSRVEELVAAGSGIARVLSRAPDQLANSLAAGWTTFHSHIASAAATGQATPTPGGAKAMRRAPPAVRRMPSW